MPLNIVVGLIALFFALLLYSMGVWGAFRKKAVQRRNLAHLWAGFAFDVVATSMMAIQIGGLDLRPGTPLLHTVLALLGMAGMLAAAILGTWAFVKRNDVVRARVATYVLAPWAVWVAVFVWGMIERGGARMGV
ncbi:MAG TPA: hypothetical protein VGK50_05945 [Coriobacteriia bacterium]|jgi:hypothetical protein